MTGHVVVEVAADDTHDLRRRVLRDDAEHAVTEWAGDRDPRTTHLAVTIDDHVVAISTWLVAPDPIAPDRRSVQLRGMATDPAMAGRGLGRALLDAGLGRAVLGGHDRVWANVRVTAVGFYVSAGWTVAGPVFATSDTGLPHRHAHIDLARTGSQLGSLSPFRR